jgi:hypothetical protein
MNRAQKSAWFGLAMSLLLILSFAWRVCYTTKPSQFSNLLLLPPAFVFFISLFSLLRKKDKASVDERDKCISIKALIAAFSSIAGLLITACIICPLITQPTAAIPILVLPALLFLLFFVFIIAYTAAILVQYSSANREEES